jgi:hypothetical protein
LKAFTPPSRKTSADFPFPSVAFQARLDPQQSA